MTLSRRTPAIFAAGLTWNFFGRTGASIRDSVRASPSAKRDSSRFAADDAGPEDRQRFEANELHVPLDLALGLRIEE